MSALYAQFAQQPLEEEIKALREKFREHYNKTENRDSIYDPRDIQRLLEGDPRWTRAVIIRAKGDVAKAFLILDKCLKWRKEFGLNDLKEEQFAPSAATLLYWKGTDKKGRRLLYFKVSGYHKDDPPYNGDNTQAKQYFGYILNKGQLEQPEGPDNQFVALLDLHGFGWSNLDMDLLKFYVTGFEELFPGFCGGLLCYDFPWILNAVWKIVQLWMEEESRRAVLFVNKTSIKEHVDPGQLAAWQHML